MQERDTETLPSIHVYLRVSQLHCRKALSTRVLSRRTEEQRLLRGKFTPCPITPVDMNASPPHADGDVPVGDAAAKKIEKMAMHDAERRVEAERRKEEARCAHDANDQVGVAANISQRRAKTQ